jgi:hypothetical protein
LFSVFLSIVVAIAAAEQMAAQTFGTLVQGEPVAAQKSGGIAGVAVSSPVYFDVTQFSSPTSDWCEQVRKAYQAAIAVNGTTDPVTHLTTSTGVVLDARGFAGGWPGFFTFSTL